MGKWWAVVLTLVTSFVASALSWEETFQISLNKGSGDLVWNSGLGRLHPPLENFNHSGANEHYTMDLGNGSLGEFIEARYSSFGSVVGSQLILDSGQYQNGLQVTRFHLAAGWTLTSTGAAPLVIKSQSDILIEGTIDCSGGAGAGLLTAGSPATGGVAKCGGQAGGVGGATPQKGSSGGPTVTGGDPGGSPGSGGGGGGGYNVANPPTNGGGASGGNKGLTDVDHAFSQINSVQGAGSGGGGGMDSGGDGGGAGGAGGGMVVLFAGQDIQVTATGSVNAVGGAGGSANGAAGGGGGGAGGSILAFAKRDILGAPFAANQMTTVGGAAGSPNGGAGGRGRTWVVDRLGVLNNGEIPVSPLVPGGSIVYQEGTFAWTSVVKDLEVSQGTVQSIDVTTTATLCGTCSIVVEVASGISSDFDASGKWSSDFPLSVERYAKYRVTVVNGDRSNSPVITKIGVQYEGTRKDQFDFVTGCGLLQNQRPRFSWSTLLFLILPLLVWIKVRLSIEQILFTR